MYIKDELGNRMKEYYESSSRTKLCRKIPVEIRVDGKAFHTFTKDLKKPFDDVFQNSMRKTMKYLCENIQGCIFGYTESDEITLVLIDYQNIDTDAWFGYEVQKMVSISASMATVAFNKFFKENVESFAGEWCNFEQESKNKELGYAKMLYDKMNFFTMFDARVFNIPKEEVTNSILWRQNDAIRNSVQMVGRTYFSHKELQNKSCEDIKEMLLEKGICWETDIPTKYKRGSACVKKETGWEVDDEMPILKKDGRKYVDDLIFI